MNTLKICVILLDFSMYYLFTNVMQNNILTGISDYRCEYMGFILLVAVFTNVKPSLEKRYILEVL